jgi:maltose O-acetyltransferase
MRRVLQLIREETYGFQPRLMLVRLMASPLPEHTCSRLRTRILRLAGFKIGCGTTFAGTPLIAGNGNLGRRLCFGSHCWVNTGLRLELGARITVCDHVTIGHEVMLITSSHEYSVPQHRAGRLTIAPITVEEGAWLGARCTILPGVTVGRGAVVAAGAVVNRDVPANTLVGGVPARVLRELPAGDREIAYAMVAPVADAYRQVSASAAVPPAASRTEGNRW